MAASRFANPLATAVFLIAGLIAVPLASNEVKAQEQTPPEQCRLTPANPPGFKPLAFVPTVIKDKRFKNRTGGPGLRGI